MHDSCSTAILLERVLTQLRFLALGQSEAKSLHQFAGQKQETNEAPELAACDFLL